AGFKAGGFVTEEIKEGSTRVGFAIRDLKGDEAVLAHMNYKGKPRVGKYGVDLNAFEEIALAALRLGRDEADFLVADEIGRMEIKSDTFRATVLEVMNSVLPLLATIPEAGDEFISDLKRRDDIEVYIINTRNRDELEGVIYEAMREKLSC
ncbi:MAG: hypothetical protein A2V52_01985, partial [Actinobacteria bacterium RBG_19FT_COMBO_54_7]